MFYVISNKSYTYIFNNLHNFFIIVNQVVKI